MNIRMIGIDHEKASLREREIFAFTMLQGKQAMKTAVQYYGMKGCIIVSTCNRTEIWVSEREDKAVDLKAMFCQLKQVNDDQQICTDELFVIREDREAYEHLFYTACGLKSQIWGEDQILAQIKNAAELARDAKTIDTPLEKLFQMAITAAKRVKTQTRLTSVDVSVATLAMERINEYFPDLGGLRCLIIGNGEMGKLIAEQLANSGCCVDVTLRQFKSGTFELPKNCTGVDYEERYQRIVDADVVVSATASPHFTVSKEPLSQVLKNNNTKKLFIDLAVPRDMEPEVNDLEQIILLDMDTIGLSKGYVKNKHSVILASHIIEECMEEFIQWFQLRDCLPLIKNIAESTSLRVSHNMKSELRKLELDEQEKSELEKKLVKVTEKAVSGLLFEIKNIMDKNLWDECFTNLEKAVR